MAVSDKLDESQVISFIIKSNRSNMRQPMPVPRSNTRQLMLTRESDAQHMDSAGGYYQLDTLTR